MAQAPVDAEEFDGYGPVPGVEVDQSFPSREALSRAKVHRPLQAGICGTKRAGGAESIVVSGGYKDDEDYGGMIIYTGHGGQDNSGQQVRNQDLDDPGNAALVMSRMNSRPVRVIRGARGGSRYSPDQGYRYDGLFVVKDHWSKKGLDGYFIWQFQMQQLGLDTADNESWVDADAFLPIGNPTPGRSERVSQAIARSRRVAESVKRAHNYTCQVCGVTLETPGGLRYAETAHIRGLGHPHNGPDEPDNTLCLCPNHHKLFDLGGITIDENLRVIDLTTGRVIGELQSLRNHHIRPEHLLYHRALYLQDRSAEGP